MGLGGGGAASWVSQAMGHTDKQGTYIFRRSKETRTIDRSVDCRSLQGHKRARSKKTFQRVTKLFPRSYRSTYTQCLSVELPGTYSYLFYLSRQYLTRSYTRSRTNHYGLGGSYYYRYINVSQVGIIDYCYDLLKQVKLVENNASRVVLFERRLLRAVISEMYLRTQSLDSFLLDQR